MTILTRVYESERGVFGRADNVLFVGWRDAPSAVDMTEWHRLARTLAREHPSAGACIDVVVRGTPRFSDEVRRGAEALGRDPKIFELGIVHALVIPGLAGTAVRTFIQTVVLVTRPVTPTKVTSDVASAVTWLAPRLAAHGWTSARLRAAADELVVAIG